MGGGDSPFDFSHLSVRISGEPSSIGCNRMQPGSRCLSRSQDNLVASKEMRGRGRGEGRRGGAEGNVLRYVGVPVERVGRTHTWDRREINRSHRSLDDRDPAWKICMV